MTPLCHLWRLQGLAIVQMVPTHPARRPSRLDLRLLTYGEGGPWRCPGFSEGTGMPKGSSWPEALLLPRGGSPGLAHGHRHPFLGAFAPPGGSPGIGRGRRLGSLGREAPSGPDSSLCDWDTSPCLSGPGGARTPLPWGPPTEINVDREGRWQALARWGLVADGSGQGQRCHLLGFQQRLCPSPWARSLHPEVTQEPRVGGVGGLEAEELLIPGEPPRAG